MPAEGVGHFGALRLVFGMEGEPILRAAEIEEHERGVGLFLIGEFPERLDPAMERAGGKAIRARQLG